MKKWTASVLLALALIPAQEGCNGSDPGPAEGPTSAPYFANCDEARRAGAAPMDKDRPGSGYDRDLDRDRDGKACEGRGNG